MPEVKVLKVPRAALRFSNPSGGFVEFSKTESGAKFKLHGYTGAAMDNMFFGKVIVDVQGVNLQKKKRASRFSILREHNPYRVLGAGTVSADESGIWVDGEFSMASRDGREVAGLLADGVPLEASISIDQVKGEEVPAGSSTEVNGKTVKGPVFVARRSRLREVSIVSLGADASTSAIAAADGTTEDVELICEEIQMAEETKAEEVAEAPVEVEADAQAPVEPAEEVPAKDPREEFAALCGEFGDAFGAKMFKAGKSVDEARIEYCEHLKARIAELEAAVGKIDDGREEGVDTGSKPEDEAPKSFKAAWKRIQTDRNAHGEKLTDYQAMKLAMKLFPGLDINS